MSPSELCQRSLVVSEVRKWLNTPYHPQGDIIGAGVDCGMLLVRVFVDTGLCEPFDPRPYADDWMLHRSEEKYLGFIIERAREVLAPQPGDVIVFRFGRCHSHGGIVTGTKPLKVVHAYKPARMVIEEEIHTNPMLSDRRRLPKYFSWWAK